MLQVVLQIDYQIETTAIPFSSTKLMSSIPATQVINEGIGVHSVIERRSEFETPYDIHFINSVGKVTHFRTASYIHFFNNLITIMTTHVLARPDNIWHRGSAFEVIRKASGATIINGYFSCILSKDS